MPVRLLYAGTVSFFATGTAAVEQVSNSSGATITAVSLLIGALASLIVALTALVKLLRPAPPSISEQLALAVLKQREEEDAHEE